MFILLYLYVNLANTFSRRLAKTSSIRFAKTFLRHLQARHLENILPRSLHDVFKTSSKGIAKMSSRHLQDVPEVYRHLKLLLLTHLQDIFERCSTPFWDVLRKLIARERCAYVTLLRNLLSGYKVSKSELFGYT